MNFSEGVLGEVIELPPINLFLLYDFGVDLFTAVYFDDDGLEKV